MTGVQTCALPISLSLSPLLRKWNQALQAVLNKDGWVKDRRGNDLYQVNSEADLIKLSLGVNPLKESDIQNRVRLWNRYEKKRSNSLNRLVTRIMKKINLGAGDETFAEVSAKALQRMKAGRVLPSSFIQALAKYAEAKKVLSEKDKDDIAAYGLDLASFTERAKMAHISPEYRALLRSKMIDKARAAGLLLGD